VELITEAIKSYKDLHEQRDNRTLEKDQLKSG